MPAEAHPETGCSGEQVLIAGVDQNQSVEFVCDGEEPIESLVSEFAAADLGADLDPEEAGAAHAPAQLGDRQIRVLQGYRAQGGEPSGVFGDETGEEVILRAAASSAAPAGSAS